MNANEHFETLAALYYKRYHRLAPGKYEAPETGRCSNDPENRVQFNAWFSEQALVDAIERIAKLEAVLRQIVDEYDDTYDASIEPGDSYWTAAASIPVEVMERAKALLR